MLLSLSSSPKFSLNPHPSLLSPPLLLPSSLLKFKSNGRAGVSILPLRCIPGPTQDAEKPKDAEKMPISMTSQSDISSYSWCAGLAGLGFVETAYLTFLKLSGSEAFCPVGGVPLPLIGMTAYGLVLLLGLKLGGWNLPLKINQSDGRLLLLSVTASMTTASAYFLYILSTRFAGSSCTYCLGSAILSFSLFFMMLKEFELQEMQKAIALPLCTAGIVFAVLGNAYSSIPPAPPSLAEVDFPYQTLEITNESSPFALSLARHLHSIGAKMYGAFWCSHCQEQKEMFGREAAKMLDYVECFPNGYRKGVLIAPECFQAGIEGFPTWVINGEVLSGIKELEELARLSGFDADKLNMQSN